MIVTAIRITFAALCMLAVYGVTLGHGASETGTGTVSKKKSPITKPAQVTPQGGISFGETATPTPAQQHRAKLKWAELDQREIDGLTAALKARKEKAPVLIVCKDPMCEDLALNLDNAFESARWKSDIMLGTQFGLPDGISASSQWLADAFNAVTHGRYAAKVDVAKNAEGEYLLIGAKPR